jgi:hypothetical protein
MCVPALLLVVFVLWTVNARVVAVIVDLTKAAVETLVSDVRLTWLFAEMTDGVSWTCIDWLHTPLTVVSLCYLKASEFVLHTRHFSLAVDT